MVTPALLGHWCIEALQVPCVPSHWASLSREVLKSDHNTLVRSQLWPVGRSLGWAWRNQQFSFAHMPSLCRASRLSHTSLNPQEHVLHQWVMSPMGLAAHIWELQPREIISAEHRAEPGLGIQECTATSKGLGIRLGRLTGGCCWLLLSQPVVLGSSAVPLEGSFPRNYDGCRDIPWHQAAGAPTLTGLSPLLTPTTGFKIFKKKKTKKQPKRRKREMTALHFPTFWNELFLNTGPPCAIPSTSMIGWSWKGPGNMHTIPWTPSPRLPAVSVRSQTSAVDQAKDLLATLQASRFQL